MQRKISWGFLDAGEMSLILINLAANWLIAAKWDMSAHRKFKRFRTGAIRGSKLHFQARCGRPAPLLITGATIAENPQ